MTFSRYRDVVLGVILTLGALLFITVLIPVGVRVPEGGGIPSLSPDFWIKIIIWSMLFVGLAITYHGARAMRADDVGDDKDSGTLPLGEAIFKVIAAVVLLFIYQQSIQWLGMAPASMIAVVVFTLLCGERCWKAIVPLAVLLPTGLYYFFLKVASIPMPLGIFDA